MAISIDSIEILKTYLIGVLDRADHHAKNLEGVALALLGAVIWKSTGQIDVREYKGETANVMWFVVNNNRYCLVYNHGSESIELKNRTQNGETMAELNNDTTYQQIIQLFNDL